MKNFLKLFLIITHLTPLYGQKDSLLFFNEYSISINQTDVGSNSNAEKKNGFGIGAYLSFQSQKKVNFVFGFEYNRTNVFFKHISTSKFGHYVKDVTYHYNCLSIPFLTRLNFGEKMKFFIEIGPYLDFQVGNTPSGMPLLAGISSGIGLKIPISTHELFLKTDYKLALYSFGSYHLWNNNFDDDSYSYRYFRLMLGFRFYSNKI
jgi:hypothetical protein